MLKRFRRNLVGGQILPLNWFSYGTLNGGIYGNYWMVRLPWVAIRYDWYSDKEMLHAPYLTMLHESGKPEEYKIRWLVIESRY